MSLKSQIRSLLKRNKYIYSLKTRILDKDYKRGKRLARQSSTPVDKMKRDYKMMKDYWHVPADIYYRYMLYDKDLSNDELLDYIPPYIFYKEWDRFLWNPEQSEMVERFNDKLELFKIFRERHIMTPEVVAVYNQHQFFDADENPISDEQLFGRLEDDKKYFFKPVDGAGGNGIKTFVKKGRLLMNKGVEYASDQLANILSENKYVIQKEICQTKQLAQVNSSSVNTLRVVVYNDSSKAHLIAVVLRMGRKNSDVDNSAQGGLSVEIDRNSGMFRSEAITEHPVGQYKEHPDSGYVFGGNTIENWPQIKNKILEYSEKFPELCLYAWDVALTDDGNDICMVELNVGFGIDHIQLSCGGMRRRLAGFMEPVIKNL